MNWYDTRTLAPLTPAYISTVDSGNLAGALLTLAVALQRLSAGSTTDGAASARTGHLDRLASRAVALHPAFRARRSSPFATKLESLPTCSVGPREMAAANMIPRT